MGQHRRWRAMVACAGVLGVAAATAGPAAAQPAEQGRDLEARVAELATVDRSEATTAQVGERTAGSVEAQAAGVCPVGFKPTIVLAEDFESGLPIETEGWSLTDDGAGGHAALSSLPAESEDVTFLGIDPVEVAPGTRTYLSFLTKGTATRDDILFGAAEEGWDVDLTEEWAQVTVDLTTATTQWEGYLDPYFMQFASPTGGEWVVDDVVLTTCTTPPASGVRGDWTGEGTVDLLATDADGTLWLYPGKASGGVYAGRAVGSGWGAMTWIGSPGDVTGDRRTDLLARAGDGTLYLYAGRGEGGFSSAKAVGSRWNGMTALITTGDVDGDGRVDLLARRSDGTLHLYRFATTGALSYLTQAGHGWNGMAWMIGTGDTNGDGRGDVLGITTTGQMYAYRGTGKGLSGAGFVGRGWGGMTAVTSPGDMNLDGKGDVLARNTAGELWFYPGKTDGLRAGTKVGTGWNGMTRIL